MERQLFSPTETGFRPRVILVGGLPKPSGGVTVFLGRLVHSIGRSLDFHILDINQGEKEPNPALTHKIAPKSKWLRYFWLSYKIVATPADIVHYNYSRPVSLFTLLLTPALNKSRCITLHNGSLTKRIETKPNFYRWLLKLSLKNVSRVFVLCEDHEEFYGSLGVPASKFVRVKSHLLPPTVKPAFVDEAHKTLSAHFNNVLVASGHVDRAYNYEFVINYLNQRPDVAAMFFVYGTSMDLTYLDEVKALLKNPDQLIVYYHRDEQTFLSALAKSSAFVRPNYVDSWGISVADACEMGLPAIASNVCERHIDANLFEDGNFDDFSRVLDDALQPQEETNSQIADENKEQRAIRTVETTFLREYREVYLESKTTKK